MAPIPKKTKKPVTKEENKKRGEDFLFKVKYTNDLPSIPFDPKLLAYPFEADRHYKYSNTTLHQSTHHVLYGEPLPCHPLSMGFIQQLFAGQEPSLKPLDPADKELLANPLDGGDKKGQKLRPIVPWLRRTGYIENPSKPSAEHASLEAQNALNAQQDELMLDTSVHGQIEFIKESFNAAAKASLSTLKHPSKPELKALEIIPIFPDFENWPNEYLLASYDSDPTAKRVEESSREDHAFKLEEALLKPRDKEGEEGVSIMSLFTPTDETVQDLRAKRRRIQDFGEDDDYTTVYDYKLRRELEANVEVSKFPLFMEIRSEDGGAFYNIVSHKINLRQKRASGSESAYHKITKMSVTMRDLNESEVAARSDVLKSVLQRELEPEQ